MKLEIVKKHLLLFKKEIEKYENISEANFQYFLLLYFHFYGNNLCPDLWFLFPELNLSRLSSQYLMENWLEQFQIFFLSELELDESSLFWIPNELAKISKVIEKRKTIQNPLKFFFENIKPEHNKLVDSIFCKLAEDNNRFPDLFFVDYN